MLRLDFDEEGGLRLRIPLADIPRRVVDPAPDPDDQRYYPRAPADAPGQGQERDIHAAAAMLLEMLTGAPPSPRQQWSGVERGELPLADPVPAPSGRPLAIEIRRGKLKPFRQRLTCRPGEVLGITAGVRRR